MTIKDAINALKYDMAMITFDPSNGNVLTLEEVKWINEDKYKSYLADELAINALEYRSPKNIRKVWDEYIETYSCYCPTCNNWLGWTYNKNTAYCEECGQKLNWG